jgi:hypothetical protein
MNKTLAAIACCLLLATTVPMGSADETQTANAPAIHQSLMASLGNPLPGPVPAHAPFTNDIGCDATATMWGFGALDTPTGPCTNFAWMTFTITHSVVNCSTYCDTFAYGFDQSTWAYGYYEAFCPTGAHGLIDWTTTPPTGFWLSGTCQLYQYGNPSDYPLYTYGYGNPGVKFSYSDSLLGALLHL